MRSTFAPALVLDEGDARSQVRLHGAIRACVRSRPQPDLAAEIGRIDQRLGELEEDRARGSCIITIGDDRDSLSTRVSSTARRSAAEDPAVWIPDRQLSSG
jgi:hypothetical protein